jgi:hypothetical protein
MEDIKLSLEKFIRKDPLLLTAEGELKTLLHRSIGVLVFQTKSK